jgi:predicted N-acetyltransferase YhbS
MRDVDFGGDDRAFAAIGELTVEAAHHLRGLGIELLRDPPQSVIVRSDEDLGRPG